MRSIIKKLFLSCAVVVSCMFSTQAQLTNWDYTGTIEITEHQGVDYIDDQILLVINTADLITNGQMKADGSDIRLASDCEGANLLSHFIESATINTAQTKIWVRVPQALAYSVTTIYFFTGNPAAAPATDFSGTFPVVLTIVANTNLTGTVNADWFEIQAGVTVGVFPGSPLVINSNKIIIDGIINANGSGGAGGVVAGGIGSGLSGGMGSGSLVQNDGAGGGGYGGKGGDGGVLFVTNFGGPVFGSTTSFANAIGSGGGGGLDSTGGNGGGSVTISGIDVSISGDIFSDGNNGLEEPVGGLRGTGGGSGGGVLVSGRYVDFSGNISANGGDGGSDSGANANFGAGGGGAGGRIKTFYYNTASLTGTFSFSGGSGGIGGTTAADGENGGVGTNHSAKLQDLYDVAVKTLVSSQPTNITGVDTVCQGSTEIYTASVIPGNTYIWSVAGGTISNGQSTNQVTINWTAAGTNTITLITINVFLGCPDTTSYSVLVSGAIPVADFTVNNMCEGQPTQFVDASTGTIVSYSWDFGDGNTSSTKDPLHTYLSVNIYNVTLSVISDLGCVAQTTKPVTIDAIPVADFTNTTPCVGVATGFTNNSVGAVSYSWNFGDGNGDNVPNPSNIYAAPGTYTVTLIATSVNGCEDVIQKSVAVNPSPVANFSFVSACPGDSVLFSNQSSISSGTLTYSWDFDDASPLSTDVDPKHVYAASGIYSVTLTATSGLTCSNSITKNVEVFTVPTASFSANTVCFGSPTIFTDATANAGIGALYAWDFDGDGIIDNILSGNASYTFTTAGTYTTSLTVTSANGCFNTFSSAVTVNVKPIANFIVDPVCFGDSTHVIDLSTGLDGAAYYEIDFYNDGAGPFPEGYYTPHLPQGDTAVLIPIVGVYETKLRVTNGNGCQDSIIGNITVYPTPVAGFTASNVCFGEAVQFTNITTIPTAPIFPMHPSTQNTFPNAFQNLTYNWDFGDGQTSIAFNTNHVYNVAGSYTVTLTVVSENGCTDVFTSVITVNLQPVANFIVDPVCFGDSTRVIDLSTGLDAGAFYEIDFYNDGSFDAGPFNAPKDTIVMIPIVGIYEAKLRVANGNGCADSLVGNIIVYPQPIVEFIADSICIGEALQFVNKTVIPTGIDPIHPFPQSPFNIHPSTQDSFLNVFTTLSYLWNFGDGNTSNDIHPIHVYTVSKIDTVMLNVVSEHGCAAADTFSLIVYPKPLVDFSAGVACFDRAVQFTALDTISFGTRTYLWQFGDGTTATERNPLHTYTTIGVYQVTLTVTSDKGCSEFITKDLIVYPNPTANFIADNVCDQDTVHFINVSSSPNNTPPGTMTYEWNFGDLSSPSIAEEPSYVYPTDGIYTVSLVATAPFGCTDTITRNVTIYPLPNVIFTFSPIPNICFGDTVDFRNASPQTGIIENFWDFGDGDVSFQLNPSHFYSAPGTYPVTLRLTSDKGCMAADTQAVVVRPLPDALIIPQGPVAFCLGGSVDLTAFPSGMSYVWSPGGETTQTIKVSTDGLVSVTVTSSFGCTEDTSIYVTVWQLPFVDAWPDTTISKGFSVQLHACCGVDYSWSPDKDLDDPNIADPIATPLETTTFVVVVTDSNGCVDSARVTVTVNPDYLVKPYNLITPNKDGYNETWEVVNILTYPDAEVLIFDRWGTLVYSKKNYDNTWDGTHDGHNLPEGSYYFVIRFEGSDRIYKGAVSILR